jgi:hypothetical protein
MARVWPDLVVMPTPRGEHYLNPYLVVLTH